MKKLLYLMLIVVITAIACKKKETYDPCDDPNIPMRTVTLTFGEGQHATNPVVGEIRELRSQIKDSAANCKVGEVHLKFNLDLSARAAGHMNNFHDAIAEAFTDASGKANGGGDTLRPAEIYTDTKLALETIKYVIIAGSVVERP
jgi:hypothetical protein